MRARGVLVQWDNTTEVGGKFDCAGDCGPNAFVILAS